jgi:hypothetical protein
MSHFVDQNPVAKVADALLKKPEVLELLRRIDGIRGPCEEAMDKEPAMNELRSRQLARFYSSYKGRTPRCWVHVLAKGDMVLDELDRRLEAAGGPKAKVRSRLSSKRVDVRAVRGAAVSA